SFSDPDSSGSLDLSTFRAILNGTDVTSSYLGSATFASPLPAGSTSAVWRMAASQALTPGDNVLHGSIADVKGAVASSTFDWSVSGAHIETIFPRSGPVGWPVTISGCGFSTSTQNTVRFNGAAPISVTSPSGVNIYVTVPSGAADGDVTVTSDGLTSNGLPFDVSLNSQSTPAAVGRDRVVADSQDRIYYAGNDHWIHLVDQSGNDQQFYSIGEEITGLATDPTRSLIYVTSRGAPTITRHVAGASVLFQTG